MKNHSSSNSCPLGSSLTQLTTYPGLSSPSRRPVRKQSVIHTVSQGCSDFPFCPSRVKINSALLLSYVKGEAAFFTLPGSAASPFAGLFSCPLPSWVWPGQAFCSGVLSPSSGGRAGEHCSTRVDACEYVSFSSLERPLHFFCGLLPWASIYAYCAVV